MEYGPLAQPVEHRTFNPQVLGSIPRGFTKLNYDDKLDIFCKYWGDDCINLLVGVSSDGKKMIKLIEMKNAPDSGYGE